MITALLILAAMGLVAGFVAVGCFMFGGKTVSTLNVLCGYQALELLGQLLFAVVTAILESR